MPKSTRKCAARECDRIHYAKTYCQLHYDRFQKYGDPEGKAQVPWYTGLPDVECIKCEKILNAGRFARGAGRVCRTCRSGMYKHGNYTLGRTCGTCATPIPNTNRSGTCRDHFQRVPKPSRRYLNMRGYAVLTQHHGHPNATPRGEVFEHTKVMAQIMGRGLVDGENVHHINGVRDDNRPENLEIWSSSQPAGQRIEDKVSWAKELLALYEPEALA